MLWLPLNNAALTLRTDNWLDISWAPTLISWTVIDLKTPIPSTFTSIRINGRNKFEFLLSFPLISMSNIVMLIQSINQ